MFPLQMNRSANHPTGAEGKFANKARRKNPTTGTWSGPSPLLDVFFFLKSDRFRKLTTCHVYRMRSFVALNRASKIWTNEY